MAVEDLLDEATLRTPPIDTDRARVAVEVRVRRRARRRATLVGASGVVAIVAAVGVFALVQPDDDGSAEVVTDDTTVAAPPELDAVAGWELMAEAPISPRMGHVAVSTGQEMVVWGGYTYDSGGRRVLADGAAYSFETGEWRLLPSAPIDGRGGAVVAWTGEEVVIVGGSDGALEPLLDAAAWNPATDEWRVVPGPGIAAASGQTGTAWTGEELVLVGTVRSDGLSTDLTEVVALDVVTGSVRSFDAVPQPDAASATTTGRSHDPRGRAAVWTGTEVLVASIADGYPVTIDSLDPVSGGWGSTVMVAVEGLDAGSDGVVWTGAELVIVSHGRPGAIYRSGATPAVVELAPSGSMTRYAAVALGSDLVSVGDRWLDLRSLTWHDADSLPGPAREAVTAISGNGRYYAWGGDACGPGASCVEFVDPGPGLVWTPPTSGTHEFDSKQ
ncbi:MAG: kelch repeat-containing protein [Acidimicrobiales bacterium]